MPHIHLETTSDLEENSKLPDILEALTAALAAHDTIPSKAIRAFHTLRSVWCMGEGAPSGFAHCEVSVLQGRPLELRTDIADSMMVVMRDQFSESISAGVVGITFELREMDRETYRK